MATLGQFLLVMIGGAIGSGMRYGVYLACSVWNAKTTFPIGTFAVNVIGSFSITLITTVALTNHVLSTNVTLFLTAGVMGGLTTYSSFNNDLVQFLKNENYSAFAINALATFVVCLGSGLLGLYAGKNWFPK